MIGDYLIRWSVRLAVCCYAVRLIYDLRDPHSDASQSAARWFWTAGCLFFVAHVIAAFHFNYHWSHSAAFAYTAKRTLEMTGWNSGEGLYVNEAFMGLWIVDTRLWWKRLNYPKNRHVYWTVQLIFAFLIFQATVIFGPWFWKPVVGLFLLFASVQLLKTMRFKTL